MAAQAYRQLRDPYSLECCLPNRGEPYIGVDEGCNRNAIFCIQHSCHKNAEGLMHQMMPLTEFKRKIDEKKFMMEKKVSVMVQSFSEFMDKLINQMRQIKLRKCLELSMLWLRDLSDNEQQYELMKRVYRVDLQGISCKQIHELYFKIIYNDQLFKKEINEMDCYKGISKALSQLSNKKQAIKLLVQKVAQIEGVLANGQILKKLLADKKVRNDKMKQVLLEEGKQQNNYQINYNVAKLQRSSANYKCLFSKYPMNPHVTYHLNMKTKYSSIMVGICEQKIKEQNEHELHHNTKAIMYNCANGNTYKDGMFLSGSNAAIQNLKQINLQLRLTSTQFFIFTNKQVLIRTSKSNLEGPLCILFQARTQLDSVQIFCDADMSADNIRIQQMISKQQPNIYPTEQQEICESPKMYQALAKEEYQQLIKSNSDNGNAKQNQLHRQKEYQQNINNQNIAVSPKLNQRILQIKSKFKQFKEIQKNEEQKKSKLESQKLQRMKYMNQMKKKIRSQALKINEKIPKRNHIKQSAYKIVDSNNEQQQKNQSQVEVKVSVSDGSDLNSVTKLTHKSITNKMNMLSKLRRGSQNMEIKSEDSMVNKIKQMAQSISPEHITSQIVSEEYHKINNIKTPPKISSIQPDDQQQISQSV